MITLNKQQINVTMFPDNTSQVWKLPFEVGEVANIDWQFTHEAELFHIMQLVDLIRQPGNKCRWISLNMDYLPYARQDKAVSNESTFALLTFAKIINSMKLDKITSIDTHSDAAVFLINNFQNVFPYTHVGAAVKECNPDILCYPDKGAIRRYCKELAFLGKIHTYGDKVRDQQTGNIVKYTLQDGIYLHNKTVLMVDDICDGGMTFIHLAKALLTAGAKSVNLYTTHGIYSKGLRPLREAKIEKIYNKDGEVGEVQGHIAIKEYK